MDNTITLGKVPVELNDVEKKKLASDLSTYKTETEKELSDWWDTAGEAANFLRGHHFGNDRSSEKNPLDTGSNSDKLYPKLPWLSKVMDDSVQYIRHDEAEPIVQAEDRVNFGLDQNEAWLSVVGQLAQVVDVEKDYHSENEVLARLQSARLDRALEKIDFDETCDEVLMLAFLQKVGAVLVGYDSDCEGDEPIFCEPIEVGQWGYDPKARNLDTARWVWYEQRGVRKVEAEARYDVKFENESMTQSGKDSNVEFDSVPTTQETVSVYHWWVRNTDKIERQVMTEAGPQTVTATKYRGGFQYCVKVNNKIVFNGQPTSPSGKPPIKPLIWKKLPLVVQGIGGYDLGRDFNKSLDRLMQYGLDATYRAQPKIGLKPGNIENMGDLEQNKTLGYIKFKQDANMQDSYMPISGGGPGAATLEYTGVLKSFGEDMLGVGGLNAEDATKSGSSGDALEGVVQDRDGSLARVKARYNLWKRAVFREMLQLIMYYEDTETTLKLTGRYGQEAFVKMNFAELQLKDRDLEASYDIRVQGPKHLPKNPVKRAQYIDSVMQRIDYWLQIDPNLALIYLKQSQVPDQKELYDYIKSKLEPAEDAPVDQPPSDIELEMQKAQLEADLEIEKRAAQSVADVLEEAGRTIAKTNPEAAQAFAMQIPTLVAQSQPQPPAPPAPQEMGPELGPDGVPIDGPMPPMG